MHSTLPVISIIVPVYGAENFLDRCIVSVLDQTFAGFELLLVDDGSPDESGEICEDYARKDKRIRVFHKENGGVSSARNLGLNEARGEWITFLDADDWLDSDYIEKFLASPDLKKDALLFQGYKKQGRVGTKGFPLRKAGARTLVENNLLLCWNTWGKCYNREIVCKLGLCFDPRLSLGEDAVFLFKYLSQVSRLDIVEGNAYNYRDTEGSLSKRALSWEDHALGSSAICEAAIPQVRRLLSREFCHCMRVLNLLGFEQFALRLGTLYSSPRDKSERVAILRKTFGPRWRLLSKCQPLFSKKRKMTVIWLLLIFLPYTWTDFLLEKTLSVRAN
ncbi:MAG: glycosyltransferase family 2 protein [Puniceicoccales bacterium]|jgi:glycosyltransferase involved in cell wall biosynthesis|nr:glycosyltransferase family 2 protein [Puniceicoccales bacterium]